MNRVLLVRCSGLDNTNPIEELDEVVSVNGSAWFGKYGARIGALPSQKRLAKEEWIVVLTSAKPQAAKAFRLIDWSIQQPRDSSQYPRYYKKFLKRISTWLNLVPLPASHQIGIDDLVVRSSRQPAKSSLRKSMRGHFWCLTRAKQ